MWYHGSSVIEKDDYMLLPPETTGVLQEKGRKKNLNRVFFTPSIGVARIYAGRSKNVNGGTKRVFRVIPMSEVVKINDDTFMCEWAFLEWLEDCSD